MVAAFTMEAAPMQTAKADNDTRVFKLFIVFPHMLWRSHFARGHGHEREVSVKQAELPFPAKSQFNYRNNIERLFNNFEVRRHLDRHRLDLAVFADRDVGGFQLTRGVIPGAVGS